MNNGPQPLQDTQRIVRAFERQTSVNVKVELVGWDVQFDRIRNAAVSGGGPDVTQAGTTQVLFFAALGGFQDLNPRIKDIGGKAAYAPGIWQTTQLAGRDGTYAIPWFTEARAIYYRKDVLEKAGIDPATAFRDWDAFQQTLQTIKDKVPTIDGKPIAPFGSPGNAASARSSSPTRRRPLFDHEPVRLSAREAPQRPLVAGRQLARDARLVGIPAQTCAARDS
jgi:multiple sugar transport system substrate-binding protein